MARPVMILWMMALLLFGGGLAFAQAKDQSRPGVLARFESNGRSDTLVLPNFWFYQPAGKVPTPFLAPGDYSVEFTGLVSVDLRGLYSLQAEVDGSLTVTVNGREVLKMAAGHTELSKRFRFNRGTNSMVARFTPPQDGPARLRLNWVPRKGWPGPIPQSQITHLQTAASEAAGSPRRGRALFVSRHCLKCHQTAGLGVPEMGMDAPSFLEMGDRLDPEWMARWIENPQAERPQARMPRMLHGTGAEDDALAIAAYLGSLQTAGPTPKRLPEKIEPLGRGKELFEDFRCGTCHSAPGTDAGPGLIALEHAGRKFRRGALVEYLLNPRAHYEWNRMPDFKLSRAEAAELAAFLAGPGKEEVAASPTLPLVQKGKILVQNSGCLSCHTGNLENHYAGGKPLAELADPDAGCLAAAGDRGSAPVFSFNERERADLAAFLRHGIGSLQNDNPREFALRQTRELNCAGCHGKAEGFTEFGLLGEKLKPEWAAAFIAGAITEKPRPWIAARMPAFPVHAEQLAKGLAMLHGYPPETEEESPVEAGLAEIGRKLVSSEGGFSCTACHAVGSSSIEQVFEAPGVNLAQSGERLRKDFFHRWMLNPLGIDPATKMPVYFDSEGRSPLTQILGGDAHKQIEAIWEYLRLGPKMPPPN